MARKQMQAPRKVLVLSPDVHASLKTAASDCGMKFQSLGNAVLRAWNRGDYFRCPETGTEAMPNRKG